MIWGLCQAGALSVWDRCGAFLASGGNRLARSPGWCWWVWVSLQHARSAAWLGALVLEGLPGDAFPLLFPGEIDTCNKCLRLNLASVAGPEGSGCHSKLNPEVPYVPCC